MDVRKVLMLCYFYPPLQTAGVARSVGFARRLAAYGWTPTVLTVSQARDSWDFMGTDYPVPEGVHVVRAPEWNLAGPVNLMDGLAIRCRRVVRRRGPWHPFRDALCTPDAQIAWRAVSRGVRLARESHCIYVSCSPFSSALKGLALKRRSGRPLVVDFRDPWTLNPHARGMTPVRMRLFRHWERRVVDQADRVILNTEGTLRLYRRAYPGYADRFVCIPNGFDQLNPPDVRPGVFTIMHVGSIYGTRSPAPLLDALLALDLPDVRFVQVGPGCPELERYRGRLDIRVTGPVPPERALEYMRGASLLYLKLGWTDGVWSYPSVVMKTYEYLATGWPVLADCPPGDNADMVRRYGHQARLVTVRDPGERTVALKQAVLRAYQNRHQVEPRVSHAFRVAFDRNRLTARLAEVFDELAESGERQRLSPTGICR